MNEWKGEGFTQDQYSFLHRKFAFKRINWHQEVEILTVLVAPTLTSHRPTLVLPTRNILFRKISIASSHSLKVKKH
jgi:hypothetical protein